MSDKQELDLVLYPLRIGFASDEDAFLTLLDGFQYEHPWVQDQGYGCTHYIGYTRLDKKPLIIVCVDKARHKNSLDIAATVVHETMHVWRKICGYIGEDNPGHETEAYTVEALAKWFFSKAGLFEDMTKS